MGAINFNDVYANAYVRESVETLVEMTVRQYPMLASYNDDIRQELWIAINEHLPKFDQNKSSINTFLGRVVLGSAMKEVRRKYFSQRSISSRTMTELNEEISADYTHNNVESNLLAEDVKIVVDTLSPIQKQICESLMDGLSINHVAQSLNIPVATLYKYHIPALRKIFIRAGLKK